MSSICPRPRLRRSILVSLLALAAAAPACGGADGVPLSDEDGASTATALSVPMSQAEMDTDHWFIELEQPPLALGGELDAIRADKNALREEARRAGLPLRERYSFERLWNGVSVRADRIALAKLSALSGVKAVFPVQRVHVTSAPTNGEELTTQMAMTGVDRAQKELGLSGAGIKVGVIDTGVDYHHPDLGGCFGPGCRVAYGYDFVGDAYNDDLGTPLVPDADPDDCWGHGTNVTGLLAAKGSIQGVAPGVILGAYKVFGCSGSSGNDAILSALERADEDGMQVINMSISDNFQWPEHPTARASTRLAEKGVIMVAGLGNSGEQGVYSGGSPAVGEGVIAVGAFNNTHAPMQHFEVSPSGARIGYYVAVGSMQPPTSGSAPLVRTGTRTTLDDACAPLPAGSLAGSIALIRRGTCLHRDKAGNAEAAGAVAVVIYNNQDGPIQTNMPPYTPKIPVITISGLQGVQLDELLDAGPLTLSWKDGFAPIVWPAGGQIPAYSSYGLSPNLTLKPEIGAPGGEVFTIHPLEKGGYKVQRGTSMSTPHVSGAVALMLEANPELTPAEARMRLMNQADPQPWGADPASGALEFVHRQGAGMVDVDDAILATTGVTPASLSLGESEGGPATRPLTVHNDSDAPVTYTISHAPAMATYGSTYAPKAAQGDASVAFSVQSVTVAPHGSASFEVTVTPSATLPDGGIHGGYVVLTDEGGGRTLRVPYAGYKGDYQSIQVLTPTANGYPWLARAVGGSYVNQQNGATFTLAEGDEPRFLVHLHHQARRLQLDVLEAGTLKPLGRALRADYLPRSEKADGFAAFTWDGTVTHGKKTEAVPEGQYVIRISVLKALGDENTPAHTETWTSPVITLDRP